MKLQTTLLAVSALCIMACSRTEQAQSVAGYIADGTTEQMLIVDSMRSGKLLQFMIDDQTLYEADELIEGNIVEVAYIPTEDEQTPIAQEITTDETYPKVLGRWALLGGERLPIDITLLPHGKIEQTLPSDILRYESWQLIAKEDTVRLFGRLSLPPIIEKRSKEDKAKSSAENEEVVVPQRRERAFTATAVVGIEGDRRTLTIVTDRGAKSTLYKQ